MSKQNKTQSPTFSIQQSTLNRALQTCSKALSESKIMPIYEYFLFDLTPGNLEISACDGKIIISTQIDVSCAIDMKLCIPGRKILDYIAKSANEIMLFEIGTHIVPESTETVIRPTTNKPLGVVTPEQISFSITIASSSNPKNKCNMPCALGIDFLKIQNVNPKPFTIAADIFLEMLYRTMFAISEDQLRPVFCGMYISIADGKMTCTATDAHKLATFTAGIDTLESADLIIPKETLQKIQSLNPKGMLDVCISKSAIDINWSEVKTRSLLIDERYVDYKSIVPTENHINFLTSKTVLTNGLKRVLPFSDMGKLVKLQIGKDSMILTAENIDYDEEATEVIAGVLSLGEPITIGVTGNYLLAVLAAVTSDEVWFNISTQNSAMLITDGERYISGKENLFLLMPNFIGGVQK
jgi:DNA polymerase-3 subunit beta